MQSAKCKMQKDSDLAVAVLFALVFLLLMIGGGALMRADVGLPPVPWQDAAGFCALYAVLVGPLMYEGGA